MEKPIAVRVASPDDAESLLRIYAPYVAHTAISFEWEVPSPAEFSRRIARTLERYPYLAAEADGVILGYAYAGAFQSRAAYGWDAEATVYVAQGGRRQGIGRQLYAALETALTAQNILNLCACIADPPADDPYLSHDSVRFHQRMGYQMVGRFRQCGYKFGRWYDMVWMEKHLGGHAADPPAVRPFGEIRAALYN